MPLHTGRGTRNPPAARLYAVNTLGSVVGAIAGTFALVALLGTNTMHRIQIGKWLI